MKEVFNLKKLFNVFGQLESLILKANQENALSPHVRKWAINQIESWIYLLEDDDDDKEIKENNKLLH